MVTDQDEIGDRHDPEIGILAQLVWMKLPLHERS